MFDVAQASGPSDPDQQGFTWRKLSPDPDRWQSDMVNNSAGVNFRTRRTQRWDALEPRPVALLGGLPLHTGGALLVGSRHQDAMEGPGRREVAGEGDQTPGAGNRRRPAAYEAERPALGASDPGIRWRPKPRLGAIAALPRHFEPCSSPITSCPPASPMAGLARRAPRSSSAGPATATGVRTHDRANGPTPFEDRRMAIPAHGSWTSWPGPDGGPL